MVDSMRMSFEARHRHTLQDYLEVEEASVVRHEFWNGEIYAMAGGTPEHAALCAAIPALLGTSLGGSGCRFYSSDLRVSTGRGLYTYPDGAIVCGELQRDPDSSTHVTNPTILFEVLSPATQAYDRGDKLDQYRGMPSVDAVVLIAQDRRHIEVYARETAFERAIFTDGDSIDLGPATLDVSALYDLSGL